MQPYYTVERPGFKKMVSKLNPRYKLPSRKHFSQQEIPRLYNLDSIQATEPTFLLRCRDHDIIPKRLHIHLPVCSCKAKLISLRTSKALLREMIGFTRRNRLQTHLDACSTKFLLCTSTSESVLISIIEWAEYHEQEEFNTVKTRQQEKFQTLLDEKLSPMRNSPIDQSISLLV